MSRRAVLRAVACAVLAAGLWQLARAAYIPAKAALAQHLLRAAWSATLEDGIHAKPWPWADTWPVARLNVPRLDAEHIVLAGASGRTLAFGPGHVAGTAAPGHPGVSVLSAHRDTHFRFLERIETGERIVVETADGATTTFRVTERRVADARRTRIALGGGRPVLVLTTCYPFDAVVPGGPGRYVVTAVAEPVP